jgi:hypothetical protein
MSLNEKDLELFKRWLKALLANGVVTVTFIKKDGTERVMNCTTATSFIPTLVPALDSKKEKKINESVMNVYDVELSAWKSFRWESVKQVRITLE